MLKDGYLLKQNAIIMSYIENPNQITQRGEQQVENDILITVQKEFYQNSVARKEQNSDSENKDLKSFVASFFKSKGIAIDPLQLSISNEITLNELSSLELHSLTLKAEELGKNITYTRSLTIKISD